MSRRVLKSPDEWATTKQVCGNGLVVYLSFSSHNIYIALLLCAEHCFTLSPFLLGSRYYNAGPEIPRNNDTFHSILPSPQGTIVSPAYEFRHDGTVTEFEFEGAKIGNVRLQVSVVNFLSSLRLLTCDELIQNMNYICRYSVLAATLAKSIVCPTSRACWTVKLVILPPRTSANLLRFSASSEGAA